MKAVDGVSFAIAKGETLGLVGESGCGKSTVGKTVLKLIEPTAGRILLGGEDVTGAQARRDVAAPPAHPDDLPGSVLVDEPAPAGRRPSSASRWRISASTRGRERDERVAACSSASACGPTPCASTPTNSPAASASGWASPRRCRSIPTLIVADEPVSALDVSVQAQVLNLLIDLQEEYGLAYLFISHDLAVMRHISHRIAVMYLGRIVELADKRTLFASPLHPYTEALLAAATAPDPKRRRKRERSCRATCRARPIRRPAAISTPAAPTQWPNARSRRRP